MKAIVKGLLTVLTVVVSLGLAGVTPAVAQEGIVACVPTVWQLTAGQTIPVGSLIVRNDSENIYVRYLLDERPRTLVSGNCIYGGAPIWRMCRRILKAPQSLANFRINLMPANRGTTRS